MFVVSVSKNKIKKSLIVGAVVIIITVISVVLLVLMGEGQHKYHETMNFVSADSEEEILSFISSCGWQVDEEPIEVRDVFIPETFDEVYNNYNKIQLEQGFNLEKYAGTRVKRWTYVIRNYPETSPSDDFIRINILVSGDSIIGGDVCSVKLDGFIHGFYIPT